jgi:hypothetical protein
MEWLQKQIDKHAILILRSIIILFFLLSLLMNLWGCAVLQGPPGYLENPLVTTIVDRTTRTVTRYTIKYCTKTKQWIYIKEELGKELEELRTERELEIDGE